MQLVIVLVHGGDGLVARHVLVHCEHDYAKRLPLVKTLANQMTGIILITT